MNLEQPNLERIFKKESILRLIEYTLLHSRKANEGNKGVILEFDLSKISPEDLALLLPEDVEVNPELLAAKVLKIYSPGQIAGEARMQERAYDLVNDPANADLDLAKVPRVYYNGEMGLENRELDHYLESSGINTVGGKVGIMLMDYIDGEDLATHLYKHIINHDPKLADLKQRLANGEEPNFNDISTRVQIALGYKKPPHQAAQAVEMKIEATNANKLFEALKLYGFELEDGVLAKIKNTIKLLHENDVYHNDLHERNVMLVMDNFGKVVDVYLIDFDRASNIEDGSVAGLDIDVVQRYDVFTKSIKEKSDPNLIFLKSIDKQRTVVENSRNPEVQKTWQDLKYKIKQIIENGGPNMLHYLDNEIYLATTDLMSNSEEWLKLAASLILDIAKDDQDLARKLVQLNMTKPANAYISNFWANLLKQL